ncbi:MAG: CotH kinase family protein [Saprospiraceae bacterium]|nr:CotH kinase family protein [Saprospiraceae bacterium]MBP6569371.1 CotH kinase family protein [Saprospiraceae bacterium]
MKIKFSIFTLFLSFHSIAQVIINEYSASNLRMYPDNYGKYEDWIELHNSGNVDVNISGWYLSDKKDKPKKWKIPGNTVIPSKGYLVFWASGRDLVSNSDFHTNFKFTQSDKDEFVVLANPSGVILESYPLILTQLHHSVAKAPNENNQWKISTSPTPGEANDVNTLYKGYATTPVISGKAGFYSNPVKVTIANSGIETIRYTLDGAVPTNSSEIFQNEINISKSSVLSAASFSDDPLVLPSFTDFKSFFINEPASTLPIISVGGGTTLIQLAEGDRSLEPLGSCEIFSSDGTFLTKSFGELDRHGQDSWINDQRSLDWISRDEMGHDSGIAYKLFHYSDRNEYQRIIMRASGDDNYPAVDDGDHEGSAHVRDEFVHTLVQKAGMHMDVRSLERYLVYLNGKYWGVYTIREKPDDHDYTEYTYKQDKYDLQFLKTWGQTWVEYGDEKALTDWIKFRRYVMENDVSKTEVYNKINNELDVTSLMDYMIANLTCVSSDWLNYNTGWWRGLNNSGKHKKWGYIMWDNDATFDYYINYSGVPDISPNAKACDIEEISDYMDEFFPLDTTLIELPPDSFYFNNMWNYIAGDTFIIYPDPGKHEKIFLKLLDESQTFRELYFARYADMLNGTFSCASMTTTLDSLISIIRPEMPRHISRWGGNMVEWEKNVKRLRDFVVKRCAKIHTGLINCYNLSGPHLVTLITHPPDKGNIRLNSQTHNTLPWNGNYFGNMTNEVEVVPVSGNKFLYWKSATGKTIFTNSTSANSKVDITGRDTLVAVFEGAVPTTDVKIQTANIYPNPADENITITLPGNTYGEIQSIIFSNDGKILKSGNHLIKNGVISWDVSDILQGHYTVYCKSNENVFVSKLIILR